MGASVITITPNVSRLDATERSFINYGTLAWSAAADTYTSGGNTCSFNHANIAGAGIPSEVKVWSATSGYEYRYKPGTGSGDGKLLIFTGAAAQSPLAELTGGGAIPAAVSGDTIYFMAKFQKIGSN